MQSQVICFYNNLDQVLLICIIVAANVFYLFSACQNPKKAAVVRRFLVSEGIFAKSGDLCCLPELLALKKRFRLRLFLEETFSFAVLGATGRGVLEHFGVSVSVAILRHNMCFTITHAATRSEE